MLLSYIVYFGLLIECWIFSYFAEKRNRKLLIWVTFYPLPWLPVCEPIR